MLKLMTLNTWQQRGPWEKRWDVIFKGIQFYAPDVIAFQEAFDKGWAAEVSRRTGFETLVFPDKHSGLVFLSRFPLLAWAEMTYARQSPLEEYRRYAVYARFDTGNRPLCCFNTHLSWKLEDVESREAQVAELIQFIDSKAGGEFICAVGDFNSTPDSEEIRTMQEGGNFTDSFAALHPGDPGITWSEHNPYTKTATLLDGAANLPSRRIDYIFLRNQSRNMARAVDIIFKEPDENGIWASDHYGLLLTLDEGAIKGNQVDA